MAVDTCSIINKKNKKYSLLKKKNLIWLHQRSKNLKYLKWLLS